MGVVHFRLDGRAVGLGLLLPPGEVVQLKRRDLILTVEAEANEHGGQEGTIGIVVQTSREIGGTAYAALEARQRISTVPETVPIWSTGGGDARLATLLPEQWWVNAPEDVVRLFADIRSELHGEGARFVGHLRWIGNATAPASPLGDEPPLFWSLDGVHWAFEPEREHHFAFEDVTWSLPSNYLEGILDDEDAEPLARGIYLEALALESENRRAAYILAFVAAETGVKQFASERSVESSEAWLLENLQAPPLFKLLREYVPTLTDIRTKDGTAFPRPMSTSFQQAAEKRNRLMHRRGEAPPTDQELADLLRSVNDLLYLLDWFSGHDWALLWVTDEVKAAYPDAEGFESRL